MVISTLVSLHEELGTDILVPQTVVTEGYWQEISAGIADAGIQLLAITLDVSDDEHERRIAGDGVEPDADGVIAEDIASNQEITDNAGVELAA